MKIDLNEALEGINFETLDETLRVPFGLLVNRVEELSSLVSLLQAELQKARDEINRLKGEKGKPDFRAQTVSKDVSSEKERKGFNPKTPKKPKHKNHKIKINRVEKCAVDKSKLPADAILKGCRSVIIQDIVIQPENIEFQRETYYSPSLKKTFVGDLPKGYEGQFGPGVKAYILSSYYESNMTESAIVRNLGTHGILISACTVSRILTDDKEAYHAEKKDIVKEGLASSLPQQMDDTGARVGGKNHFTHILCHDLYTCFFTRPNKDRLTLLEILTQGPLTFKFNDTTYALMEQMKVSEKSRAFLKNRFLLQPQEELSRPQMDALLQELFPNPEKHKSARKAILEAAALVAYRSSPGAISLLMTDNAPQFQSIAEFSALCWIHEGRHYKKLTPYLTRHKKKVAIFLTKFWNYYRDLLQYKAAPSLDFAEKLSLDFDTLFSEKTGYNDLDERIAMTHSRKGALTLVLSFPELPLHNNASELGARAQARKRDISLHTVNQKGTEAKDTLMTIVETAKKHGVNIYRYFYDRVTQKYEIPSLAALIKQGSQTGNLGLSPPVAT